MSNFWATVFACVITGYAMPFYWAGALYELVATSFQEGRRYMRETIGTDKD